MSVLLFDSLVKLLHSLLQLEHLRTLERVLLETLCDCRLRFRCKVFEGKHLHDDTLSVEAAFLCQVVDPVKRFKALLSLDGLDESADHYHLGVVLGDEHLDATVHFLDAVRHS